LRRFQRIEQLAGACCDRTDRVLECELIALRRFGRSAHFAHELQRGIVDLLIRRGRIEIEQGFYISAHDLLPVIVSSIERRVASTENSRVSVNGNRSNGGTLCAARQDAAPSVRFVVVVGFKAGSLRIESTRNLNAPLHQKLPVG
jgi:hypothetical protein